MKLRGEELRALTVLGDCWPNPARFASITTARGFTSSDGTDHVGPHIYGPAADKLAERGWVRIVGATDVELTDEGLVAYGLYCVDWDGR